MPVLEDPKQGRCRGILPNAPVTVVSKEWYGSDALEPTYKTPESTPAN